MTLAGTTAAAGQPSVGFHLSALLGARGPLGVTDALDAVDAELATRPTPRPGPRRAPAARSRARRRRDLADDGASRAPAAHRVCAVIAQPAASRKAGPWKAIDVLARAQRALHRRRWGAPAAIRAARRVATEAHRACGLGPTCPDGGTHDDRARRDDDA